MATKTHIYNDMRTEGNITKRQIDPYELLANAVIELAVQDYRMLRSGRIPTVSEETQLNMKKKFEVRMLLEQKEAVMKFFKSKWYADLTDLPSNVLLERLNSEPVKHWKPASEYVVVSAERLKEEIERRMLGNSMLYRLTKVKGDYFVSIVNTKKVIIPKKRALKICNGLGIQENEFILRKWSDKE
jgi:hypothetical protein